MTYWESAGSQNINHLILIFVDKNTNLQELQNS